MYSKQKTRAEILRNLIVALNKLQNKGETYESSCATGFESFAIDLELK